MFYRWKACPIEFPNMNHSYSFASKYYQIRRIKGILHYKITGKGVFKIKQRRLGVEIHNFLVYLRGYGTRLINENEFENGDIR